MAYYCITGANSGLGLKTVMTLLSEPEDAVVFGLDINTAAMESNPSLAAHLKQRKLFPIRTDVTSSASVAAATAVIARLLEEHGQGLDGVAHFAGVNEGGPLVEMKDEDFTRVINVNVTGVLIYYIQTTRALHCPANTGGTEHHPISAFLSLSLPPSLSLSLPPSLSLSVGYTLLLSTVC